MILAEKPIFIHSDIGLAFIDIKKNGFFIDSKNINQSIFNFICKLVDGDENKVLFPAFNYNFGNSRVFDPENDDVQVGVLPEWVRLNKAFTRTKIPFFSFLSKSSLSVIEAETINPFGKFSGFDWLHKNDSIILLLGAPCSSLTFIHYVEEMSGGPIYRYIKRFPGYIIDHGEKKKINLEMHVRPMGANLNYDWNKIEYDLTENRILKKLKGCNNIRYLETRKLFEFWNFKIQADPFYLLNDESRSLFQELTKFGKKRVTINQFEK